VTSANSHELPTGGEVPAAAVDAAEHGVVVWLTRDGERVAAVVPLNVAAAGAAVVTALRTRAGAGPAASQRHHS
jgi:antitoxin (DNA-binding transcriptional repressor) of toxin-antitoxin stability system